MEKSKLFIGAGALVLAISAFTTNTKDKKFAGTRSAYFLTSGGWNTLFKGLSADAPRLTTIKASSANKTAFFRTAASYTLFKAKSTLGGNTLFTK